MEAVGDAGGLQQQILDNDRPTQRHKIERRLCIVDLALYADLHVGKGRNIFADGIIQRDLSAVDQHQRRDAGDGLGDRMDRKDRIRRHRRAGIDIALAEAFEIDRLAMLLDQHDRAGNPPRFDFAVDETVDRSKFFDR